MDGVSAFLFMLGLVFGASQLDGLSIQIIVGCILIL